MSNYPTGARYDKSAPYNQPEELTLHEENEFQTTLTRKADMEWRESDGKPDKEGYFQRNNFSITELLKMYLDLLNETGSKYTFLKDEIRAWLQNEDESIKTI